MSVCVWVDGEKKKPKKKKKKKRNSDLQSLSMQGFEVKLCEGKRERLKKKSPKKEEKKENKERNRGGELTV